LSSHIQATVNAAAATSPAVVSNAKSHRNHLNRAAMAADDNDRMSAPPLSSYSTVGALSGQVQLSDWGVIRAQGAEAAKFLHGQLTQDIEHLQSGASCLAGYCSAKGRLMATFVVHRLSDDELLLACSADVLQAVLKRLTMFVLRAKCKLSDGSAESPLWGVVGTVSWPAGSVVASLPDALVDGQRLPRALMFGTSPTGLPSLDINTWRWLEVMSGAARVVAATSEQFVPQMVNLEVVGGVNFQKGCYPGQEVVARSQYRGTLKRRAWVLKSAVALQPGQEIFHSADPGQPAGMVVLAGSQAADDHAVLAEVKLAALSSGSLHAGSADGPLLQPLPQPYALPTEAA
jgi:tRNA-modifying protein YgfZ